MPSVEKVARTDSGLASSLRVSVSRLSRRLRAESTPGQGAPAVSIGGISVLGHLFREGERTLGQLAAAERVQPPSMTRTVNCLEQDGLVERSPHPTDGRQVVIGLTPAADELLDAEARSREAWLSGRLQQLSPEERTVLREAAVIMDKLASG